ncbi:unnamed protein product [Durusdinium trenchii]|uniref:Ion transport domain-containing protein n=1 Tax=Durusdinium trenchii TaxID=1381693 RepID=A0ABP0I9F7_9DINO
MFDCMNHTNGQPRKWSGLSPDQLLQDLVQQMDTFLEESQRSKELANMQESLCQQMQASLKSLMTPVEVTVRDRESEVWADDDENHGEVPNERGQSTQELMITYNPDADGLLPVNSPVTSLPVSGFQVGSEFTDESDLSMDWLGLGEQRTLKASQSLRMKQHSERMQKGMAQWSLNRLARAMSAVESLQAIREPVRRGRLANVVQSIYFNMFSLVVIILNSIYITALADKELSQPGVAVEQTMAIEVAFSIFYCLELAAKLVVHRCYFFWNEDWCWNLLDFFLVVVVLVESLISAVSVSDPTGSMNIMFVRVLRLFKLARVLRIMRTFRFFTELRLMTECVVGSLLNALWCVALLFIVKFIFALLIAQALIGHWVEKGVDPDMVHAFTYFYPSVSGIMLTLLQSTTSGVDWRDPFEALQDIEILPVLFVAFILVFTVSIWNIVSCCQSSLVPVTQVTSVFVEKALKLAQPDLDGIVLEQVGQEKAMFNHLISFFAGTASDDENADVGEISAKAFRDKVDDPKFRCYLSAHGIDIKNVKTFFSMLHQQCGEEGVDIRRLAHACVRMKGVATSIDLQSLSFETRLMHRKELQMMRRMGEQLRRTTEALERMAGQVHVL